MSYNLKIKKLYEDSIIPSAGSAMAAGLDLYAHIDNDIQILPQSLVKIGTGIAITPPEKYFGAVFARSGMGINRGLRPGNCVGIIDRDYTGEVIVGLYNDSDEYQMIHNGDRIAQLVLLPYIPDINIELVDSLENTERSDKGFGSSGN